MEETMVQATQVMEESWCQATQRMEETFVQTEAEYPQEVFKESLDKETQTENDNLVTNRYNKNL